MCCTMTQGSPPGILRHESGANFNMGLDGASPLFAGICTPEQEQPDPERPSSPEAHVDATSG